MDKTTAGLLGAVAGLATMGAANAAASPAPNPSGFLQVSSYADLLAPVQDATALLKADDARVNEGVRQDDTQRVPEDVQLAQYYNYAAPPRYHHHHHHHHHHHQAYRRDPHHHSSYVGIPGVGGVYVR